jgi:glycogen synthase
MHIALLTNEYPPYIYGGAGVHVEYLARELTALDAQEHSLTVLCFGDQQEQTDKTKLQGIHHTFTLPAHDPRHQKFFDTLLRNILMAGSVHDVDIVHCHTWYTHFAGCLLKQLWHIPLVLTTHSLEPHRPWKAEQLGSAYQATTWLEKTAYANADGVIAVSLSMQRDVQALYGVPPERIRLIPNGIDIHQYKPTPNLAVLETYHIHPEQPFLLFVGRITPQKGIIHLLNAVPYLHPGVQVVLCASAPDTKVLEQAVAAKVTQINATAQHTMIWIPDMVPREHLISLYTHAAVFVCPSIYEPFGIINLEAMACETPVVASAVGGIPEVVVHNETGLLVPLEPLSPDNAEPKDPEQFAQDLASALNRLLASPETMQAMRKQARKRVEQYFSWRSVAQQTLEFYQALTTKGKRATQ